MTYTKHTPTPVTDALELEIELSGRRDVPVRVYHQMRILEQQRNELRAALEVCFAILDDTGVTKNSPLRTAWESARAAILKATQ